MNSSLESILVPDRYAHKILETYHQLFETDPGEDDHETPFIVGIIGAGAAGLYTAMILQSLGIEYEILEADSKVGGRLFTHQFSSAPNDYYDVGAMRFPDTPLMHRTFDLFERLKFDDKTLIPYIMTTGNDITLFNGYFGTGNPTGDPFHVSVSEGGTVPDSFVQQGYSNLVDAKLKKFRKALVHNFDDGWKQLMEYDGYSMRTYMSLVDPQYPDAVIDWCETMETGTGLYDFALSESVLESLDFHYPTPPTKPVQWYCIQGGTQTIANKMRDSLGPTPAIRYRKRVTSISPSTNRPGINVVVDGEAAPRTYSHVVSTMPLSCLRMVDTDSCNLPYALKTALRELHYEASVKVAIKFTDRWWEPQHKGGVSTTDRPTRVVVYPSYGIGGDVATMICSYTWSQDALRLGALVHGRDSLTEELLVRLILQDLAVMHGIEYETLNQKVVDYHAWNWYANEFSCGAFAYFGPGQFSNIYQEVTKPAAGGLLHFAGEATSVNHAWVVGALNSAYRSVLEILTDLKLSELQAKLIQLWGTTDEVRQDLVEKQVFLARRGPAKVSEA